MRSLLRRLIPRFLIVAGQRTLASLDLLREFGYDYWNFLRHSSYVFWADTRAKLRALILIDAHGLEKGMALRNPRAGFGREKSRLLLQRLAEYTRRYGPDQTVRDALSVLHHYNRFTSLTRGQPADYWATIDELDALIGHGHYAGLPTGTKILEREEFLAAARHDLSAFFQTRCSVRQYEPRPVDPALLRQAAEIARKTPSVCNRQTCKVRVLTDPVQIKKALQLQAGAGGFENEVSTLLVVTSDLANFRCSEERYQYWIDGGLFAMTLIYALHSLGLVSCCLNWAQSSDTDRRFKKSFQIPPQEAVIMLITVGYPCATIVAACSPRKPVEEILEFAPPSPA